jgi:hypothetical protein
MGLPVGCGPTDYRGCVMKLATAWSVRHRLLEKPTARARCPSPTWWCERRCPEEAVAAAEAALGAGEDEAIPSIEAGAQDEPCGPEEDRGGAAGPVGEGWRRSTTPRWQPTGHGRPCRAIAACWKGLADDARSAVRHFDPSVARSCAGRLPGGRTPRGYWFFNRCAAVARR